MSKAHEWIEEKCLCCGKRGPCIDDFLCGTCRGRFNRSKKSSIENSGRKQYDKSLLSWALDIQLEDEDDPLWDNVVKIVEAKR